MKPSAVNDAARKLMADAVSYAEEKIVLVTNGMRITAAPDGYTVTVEDRQYFIPRRHYNLHTEALRLAASIIERMEVGR